MNKQDCSCKSQDFNLEINIGNIGALTDEQLNGYKKSLQDAIKAVSREQALRAEEKAMKEKAEKEASREAASWSATMDYEDMLYAKHVGSGHRKVHSF